ncbi:MAG: flagellar hook assembly protein FlgD [Deltaproteobacteria bacterium]|nr:flagellar hook assembly protein FlgD [Deltaproteobacteria bacterium]
MIADVIGVSDVQGENVYTQKTQDTLGRDQFLTMFLAQLKYQDPLNPMEGTEFSSQLAQFSSLEQLFNVNENLQSIKTLQDDNSRLQALDLIGKEVEAEGDVLSLADGSSAQGSFSLEDGAECAVRIYDQQGLLVREIQMGKLSSGFHSFEWDGLNQKGDLSDPGMYGFEINALNDEGETLQVGTRIKGLVSRVNLDNDTPLLYVGEIPVTLTQILEIRSPDAGNTGDQQNE